MNDTQQSQPRKPVKIKITSVLRARCPACHEGDILTGFFTIRERCPVCDYNLHPEPGFYLGAMMVGFLVTAMLTIPPMIFLKLMDVDTKILLAFPFIEFIFVGTFLIFYCRILWLHLEYKMSNRLDSTSPPDRK